MGGFGRQSNVSLELVAHDLHLTNPHIPAELFLELLNDARVWQWDWGVIFAVKNDMHIHVMTSHRKKVYFRKHLREVTDAMFNEYPVLTTSVLKSRPAALRFDSRMGWKVVGETETMWKLEMTKKDFKYGKS